MNHLTKEQLERTEDEWLSLIAGIEEPQLRFQMASIVWWDLCAHQFARFKSIALYELSQRWNRRIDCERSAVEHQFRRLGYDAIHWKRAKNTMMRQGQVEITGE